MARYTRQEVAAARERCLDLFPKGSTVYLILRGVSASGMTRYFDAYAIKENQPIYASGWVAKVLGWSRNKDGAIVVRGTGMDMSFHLVYELGYALYTSGPDGRPPGYAMKRELL